MPNLGLLYTQHRGMDCGVKFGNDEVGESGETHEG